MLSADCCHGMSARYGISEEDARKLAQEAADENRQPELSFGGGG